MRGPTGMNKRPGAHGPVARAELVGGFLVVWDHDEARQLYRLGFYGKPLGIPKPKGADFDAPLVLDLLEGLYLLEKGLLKVYERVKAEGAPSDVGGRERASVWHRLGFLLRRLRPRLLGRGWCRPRARAPAQHRIRELRPEALRELGRRLHEDFEAKYAVYKDLRDAGLVVTTGIKFGCDFAVYRRGPGLEHAPYLVAVRKPEDTITAPDIVRAGRLATTVRKRFVLALVDEKTGAVRYLMFKWFRA